MEKRYVFYIIDEDNNQNEILQKLILKVFPTMYVKVFLSPYNAWKSLEREKLDVVIFCEYDLQNFNGLSFIKKVRSDENLKDSYCVLMAQFSDRELISKANQIGVDEFIYKPISYDNFYLKLKTLARIFDADSSINELATKLSEYENAFSPLELNIRKLFLKIQSYRAPEKDFGNIIQAVRFIAEQLTDDEAEILEMEKAAQLCWLPKTMLKDRFMEAPVMVDGIIENDAMRAYFKIAKDLMSDIEGFEDTLNILYHIYENFDGSGEPDKMKSWQIPLGSRILRVVLDFDFLFNRHPKAIEKLVPLMWTQINRIYDFRILAYYDQYLAYKNTISSESKRPSEVLIRPIMLEPNMIISRNIITSSGLKLLNAGTKLSEQVIKKIQETNYNNDLLGNIFVRIESIPMQNK